MQDSFSKSIKLITAPLWKKFESKRKLFAFDLEITARCNNNCRHCYINLPANDKNAQKKELSLKELKKIIDQAVDLGALWCLITGGEPLLRKDFSQIYLYLKKKGILVSVFTNATLINKKHIRLFKDFSLRDIEITVYGTTAEVYERVTRSPGSFASFRRGLNLLLVNGINPRLKAMAMRSNVSQIPQIERFCQKTTKDCFRFDHFLHLRFDRDQKKNKEIKSERLSTEEIIEIEQKNPERLASLKEKCIKSAHSTTINTDRDLLFRCGAGKGSFTVSYDGYFHPCPSLLHESYIYNLKEIKLADAWNNFTHQAQNVRSEKETFLKKCQACPIANICTWCPAHSHLETGELDSPIDYFCEVAHARVESAKKQIDKKR